MVVDSALLPAPLSWLFAILFGLALVFALRLAPWRKLRDPEQLHVFFGAVLVLILLWHMRVDVQPGLTFHLLGLTAVTLMIGWSLAVIGAILALAAVTFNGDGGWSSFAVNAMIGGVIPITLTQILLILIRWYLPRHFFVFVMVNGFLTAGFVGIASGYIAAWLLIAGGAYSFAELNQTFLPFFPLMFLPEAILNGWVIVVLVAFRPQWVYSFSDEQYLKGK
jgi:uncharacterized membrane protein